MFGKNKQLKDKPSKASSNKRSAKKSSEKKKTSPSQKSKSLALKGSGKSSSKDTTGRKPVKKSTAGKSPLKTSRSSSGKKLSTRKKASPDLSKSSSPKSRAKSQKARPSSGKKSLYRKISAKTSPKTSPKTKTASGASVNKKSTLSVSKPAKKKPRKTGTVSRIHGPGGRLPCRAYRGHLPYIFISYAHRDMAQVFRILKKLGTKRYRIWYDEGIEPGSEWPETVGRAIINCTQFLVFMSPWATCSRNVRNEINLAFAENRDILVVFLEPTVLTDGMKLQIGTVQFINRYEISEKECIKQLTKVLSSFTRG